ncbi:DUF4189 domain-containing protein [Arthrobacter sp. FW305-BF8]|uniref:DUF4189 domain-containing protein n=1 Tax=Arthrobacter sp. FW305-BF8 TaxID=2879617 RepID=UPI001F22DDD4|nr:DUF4189 domain-containing protein [Arthrobacter sp. FW305-BF8]UKA53945.1 DUF4189 domain-containing protein [Arthrobacter sp. FW305-BF8]
MKTSPGRRRPLAIVILLMAFLFSGSGLTAAASPLATLAQSTVQAKAAAADRYVSFAFYPGNFAGWQAFASSGEEARNIALDQCNRNQSEGKYNCISTGYAHNAYLAVAVSKPYGAWGSNANTSATYAGQWALYYCQKYGGGNDCRVIYNRHSSEG